MKTFLTPFLLAFATFAAAADPPLPTPDRPAITPDANPQRPLPAPLALPAPNVEVVPPPMPPAITWNVWVFQFINNQWVLQNDRCLATTDLKKAADYLVQLDNVPGVFPYSTVPWGAANTGGVFHNTNEVQPPTNTLTPAIKTFSVWVFKIVDGKWVKDDTYSWDTGLYFTARVDAVTYANKIDAIPGWCATTNAPPTIRVPSQTSAFGTPIAPVAVNTILTNRFPGKRGPAAPAAATALASEQWKNMLNPTLADRADAIADNVHDDGNGHILGPLDSSCPPLPTAKATAAPEPTSPLPAPPPITWHVWGYHWNGASWDKVADHCLVTTDLKQAVDYINDIESYHEWSSATDIPLPFATLTRWYDGCATAIGNPSGNYPVGIQETDPLLNILKNLDVWVYEYVDGKWVKNEKFSHDGFHWPERAWQYSNRVNRLPGWKAVTNTPLLVPKEKQYVFGGIVKNFPYDARIIDRGVPCNPVPGSSLVGHDYALSFDVPFNHTIYHYHRYYH